MPILRIAVVLMFLLPVSAWACIICRGDFRASATLREEAERGGKMILHGTLANARVNPSGEGGSVEFTVIDAIRDDPWRAGRTTLTLPRYVPSDPKSPPRYLLYCEMPEGKLDPYRGIPLKSAAVVKYLRDALAIDRRDRAKLLRYFAGHFDAADPTVTTDAYIEFAKANDREVCAAAPLLESARLRKLVTDPATPPDRLGLFAYLLAAGGNEEDKALLARFAKDPPEAAKSSRTGFIAAYIQARPAEGWQFARTFAADAKRPFPERQAVLQAVQFFAAGRPTEFVDERLAVLGAFVEQGDIADLACEELRRSKMWGATATVLQQYDRPTHASPLIRRALLRYALTCPLPEATAFVAAAAKRDEEMVRDVREGIAFELEVKPPTK